MAITHLLNQTATIQSMTKTTDGRGGHKETFSGTTTVKCRVRPASSQEIFLAAAEKREVTHIVYTDPGSGLVRGDHLVIGSTTLEVLLLRNPSESGSHEEIDCKQVVSEVSTHGSD